MYMKLNHFKQCHSRGYCYFTKIAIVSFLAVISLFVSNLEAAFFKRGVEQHNVRASEVNVSVDKIFWGSADDDPETDSVICQISTASSSIGNVILVFHTFDSTGEYLSSFSMSALSFYDLASFTTKFRRDRQIRTLKLVNVVLNDTEVIYNLRVATPKVMRSLTKPTMFKNLHNSRFENNDKESKWNPEPETATISKKHTFDDNRSKNIPLKDVNKKNKMLGKEQRVHLNPGQPKKIATCEGGDLIIFRYYSGVCGPSIEQRKSPDEAISNARPIVIRRTFEDGKNRDEEIPINPDTVGRPQGLLCESPAVYGIMLPKELIGSVTYKYWVIPASQVEQFLKTPAGELVSLEQESFEIMSD